MRFSILKLLALVLVFGLLMGCLAACSDQGTTTGSNPNNSPSNNGNGQNTSGDNTDLRDGLTLHFFQGLTYFISEDFRPSDATNEDYDLWINDNSGAVFCVSCELAPNGVTSSLTYATHYLQKTQSQGYTVTMDSANGIYYTLTDYKDGTYEVRGFYVHDKYGWNIYVTTPSNSEQQRWIDYTTIAEIDTTYTPDLGETGNQGNTGTESTPNPDGTVTVHTLVPTSWGNPGCWAWKDGGNNVFDAWPGESMSKTGTYYTIDIPAWADYVIINGNAGSIQTADISVEPGCDIWILIHQTGSYYGLFYQEPTAAELAEYGY